MLFNMKNLTLSLCIASLILSGCGSDSQSAVSKTKASAVKTAPQPRSPQDAAADIVAHDAYMQAKRAAADFASKQNGILVMGDNLSSAENMDDLQGWVGLLGKRLSQSSPPIPVINVSITGDTADGGAARVGMMLSKYNPKILIVELGSRDMAKARDIKEISMDLDTIISTAHDVNVQVLLLGSQPDIADLPKDAPRDYAEKAKTLYVNTAQRDHVALVPNFMSPITRLDPIAASKLMVQMQAAIEELVWPSLYPVLKSAKLETSLPAPAPAPSEQDAQQPILAPNADSDANVPSLAHDAGSDANQASPAANFTDIRTTGSHVHSATASKSTTPGGAAPDKRP